MKYAKIIKYRNFSKTNMQKYSAALRGLNWDFLEIIDNTQLAYDQFYNIFFDLYNLHFPLLSKSLNKNVHGFHTKGLLISRNRKLMLCKLSLKHPSDESISCYRSYRNLSAKIIKASKKLYFEKQLSKYQSDSKKTWEILRKAINNTKKVITLSKILLLMVYMLMIPLLWQQSLILFLLLLQKKLFRIFTRLMQTSLLSL